MKGQDKVCDRETAGILALAWRCLYAEITRSRIENTDFNLQKALSRVLNMLKSRILAYGTKWRRWYMRTSRTTRAKKVPRKHQKYKLIKVNDNAEFEISEKMTTG